MKTIERTGEYRGIKWEVVLHSMGHRCGYVYATCDRPYDLEVHGGITYTDAECIGFDCAHSFDGPDVEAVREQWGDEVVESDCFKFGFGELKSADFVETECKNLIDQIKEVD